MNRISLLLGLLILGLIQSVGAMTPHSQELLALGFNKRSKLSDDQINDIVTYIGDNTCLGSGECLLNIFVYRYDNEYLQTRNERRHLNMMVSFIESKLKISTEDIQFINIVLGGDNYLNEFLGDDFKYYYLITFKEVVDSPR